MGVALVVGFIGSLFSLFYGLKEDAYPLMIATGILGLAICGIYVVGIIETSGISGLIDIVSMPR